ncbi:MAG: aspartate ammonia-lyase [Chlamydiota bacterium]
MSGKTRKEHDLLGDREVPYDAYYGIQTFRGLENFPITGIPLSHYPMLINALAMVKMAAAMANKELKLINKNVATAIFDAGSEILMGKYHDHFALDMIQGGAGTSTNMNVNEVMANRALELLGHNRGEYEYCHPNNHVNLSQSTNDAYPSALKLAMYFNNSELISFLEKLIISFRHKSQEFKDVYKIGRTQLQDAVPMTLGQEFEVFAATLHEEVQYLKQNAKYFLKLNLGGTAIGTGINTVKSFGRLAVNNLKKISGLELSLASNLIESTQSTSAFVTYSSALKQLAIKLSKICNDLRLLSSGPRAGLSEIRLPERQPGSSIMPGKVNPVIPEAVNQISFKVIGNDLTVSLAAEAGQLQLNVMEPVIAKCILESVEMLKNACDILRFHCVDGIQANRERCYDYVYNSIGLVTALCPHVGYETSSNLAKEALKSGRSIYDIALEKKLLTQKELDQILDPKNMIKPQLKKSVKG